MKIRIVLADTDEKYINHFIRAFKIYYFHEVDIVTFSDLTALKKYISSRAYDILLSVASLLPKEAEGKGMILTSEMGIKEINGRPAICKYQKIENLYKGILDAIAEQKSGITYSYETSKESPVIAFTSAAGGVGKTTAALVYTRQLVKKGFQVMYLSLESFSNIDYFLNAEGSSNFSNVLFAVKCGKGNLQMKIESSLKQTYGGVYFFSKPMNPNEIDELDQSEWKEFLDAVRAVGKFHCIVIDLPCANEDTAKKIMPLSDRVLFITDGSDTTTEKTQTLMTCISKYDEVNGADLSTKVSVIQNKCEGPRREIGLPILAELPYIKETRMEKLIMDTLVNAENASLLSIYQPGGQEYV